MYFICWVSSYEHTHKQKYTHLKYILNFKVYEYIHSSSMFVIIFIRPTCVSNINIISSMGKNIDYAQDIKVTISHKTAKDCRTRPSLREQLRLMIAERQTLSRPSTPRVSQDIRNRYFHALGCGGRAGQSCLGRQGFSAICQGSSQGPQVTRPSLTLSMCIDYWIYGIFSENEMVLWEGRIWIMLKSRLMLQKGIAFR